MKRPVLLALTASLAAITLTGDAFAREIKLLNVS